MVTGTALRYIESLDPTQAGELHGLFQNEWWTRGRGLDEVLLMLRGSDLVVGYCEDPSGQLAAFARVLTDRVFKAFIFDLIVRPTYRGRGLGRDLVERITGHPGLSKVRHFELYCLPELVPFYRSLGFSEEVGRLQLMRREEGIL